MPKRVKVQSANAEARIDIIVGQTHYQLPGNVKKMMSAAVNNFSVKIEDTEVVVDSVPTENIPGAILITYIKKGK